MADDEKSVTDDEIAALAARAALSTAGVHSLQAGFTESIQGNILGRNVGTPGVRVSRDGKRTVIDMTIMTEYGYNIPSLAWNVQEHVKKYIAARTGVDVNIVNIHVPKIYFGAAEDDKNGKKS